jgi:hypothetical protein
MLLIPCNAFSIAMGCIYTESKGYPREPAAHVAIRKLPSLLAELEPQISVVDKS